MHFVQESRVAHLPTFSWLEELPPVKPNWWIGQFYQNCETFLSNFPGVHFTIENVPHYLRKKPTNSLLKLLMVLVTFAAKRCCSRIKVLLQKAIFHRRRRHRMEPFLARDLWYDSRFALRHASKKTACLCEIQFHALHFYIFTSAQHFSYVKKIMNEIGFRQIDISIRLQNISWNQFANHIVWFIWFIRK